MRAKGQLKDTDGILSAKNFRDSKEGQEVHEHIRTKHGFMVPVFMTNSLVTEIVPDIITAKNARITISHNMSLILQVLKEHTKERTDPNVVFDAVIPVWSKEKQELTGKDLKLVATISIASDSPFVIIASYDEVKDLFE